MGSGKNTLGRGNSECKGAEAHVCTGNTGMVREGAGTQGCGQAAVSLGPVHSQRGQGSAGTGSGLGRKQGARRGTGSGWGRKQGAG